MRIALFSDIHGHISGLKAVLARLEKIGGADAIYALGDFIGGGPGLDDVMDLLLAHDVQMVRGNWDEVFIDLDTQLGRVEAQYHEEFLRTYEWTSTGLSAGYQTLIAELPLTQTVDLSPDYSLLLCHAAPNDAWADVCRATTETMVLRETFCTQPTNVIAYGHYHSHHILQVDEKTLINTASVGLGWHGYSTLTLLEVENGKLSIQQSQAPYDILEHDRLVKERAMPHSSAIWYWTP